MLVLIGLLRVQNAALAEQVAVQSEYVERLQAENERLRARVAELQQRLNRDSGKANLRPSAATLRPPGAEAEESFDSQKDVLLHVAAEGWNRLAPARWATAVNVTDLTPSSRVRHLVVGPVAEHRVEHVAVSSGQTFGP